MICSIALLINLTSLPWNNHDYNTAGIARHGCAIKYKNSPCLSKFIKVGPQDYQVLCKAKEPQHATK